MCNAFNFLLYLPQEFIMWRCALIWWAQRCMNQSNTCSYDVSFVYGFTCSLKLSQTKMLVLVGFCYKVNFASWIFHVIGVVQSFGALKSAQTNQLFWFIPWAPYMDSLVVEIIFLGPAWLVSKLNLPKEIREFWNSVFGLSDLKWLAIMWWPFSKPWIWLVCGL